MKTIMKINQVKLYFFAIATLFAFTFSSCSKEEVNSPLNEDLSKTTNNDLFAKKKVSSVVGTGSTLIADNVRHYAFHASIDENGDVSGTMQFNNQAGNINLHGDIYCLNILNDNSAVLNGITTNVNEDNPGGVQVGQEFWFKIIDNGEGKNAPADQFSNFILTSLPCGFDLFGITMNDILNGNIQVKP